MLRHARWTTCRSARFPLGPEAPVEAYLLPLLLSQLAKSLRRSGMRRRGISQPPAICQLWWMTTARAQYPRLGRPSRARAQAGE